MYVKSPTHSVLAFFCVFISLTQSKFNPLEHKENPPSPKDPLKQTALLRYVTFFCRLICTSTFHHHHHVCMFKHVHVIVEYAYIHNILIPSTYIHTYIYILIDIYSKPKSPVVSSFSCKLYTYITTYTYTYLTTYCKQNKQTDTLEN